MESTMRALVLTALNQPLEYMAMPLPVPGKNEILVSLQAAALNHRDVYIQQGLYANIRLPCILGSDGAGECAGKPVLIYPALDWGSNPAAQGKDFRVLGMPEYGTFAHLIAVPKKNIYPMPAHLSSEQAAALPLAGLTAWRTLFTRCRLKKAEKVLITGIGGGVALTAMQFALAAGATVFVSSGADDKIEKAARMGAHGGANYRETDWDKKLRKEAGLFDVIIDSAGGDGFSALMSLCAPGCRIGMYGGSLGKINGLSPQILFWKQVSILGSTMGTRAEFKKMLDFVTRHEIVPVVDTVYPLASGNEAMQRMDQGTQFGKLVLRISQNDR